MKKLFVFILGVICLSFTSCKNSNNEVPKDYEVLSMMVDDNHMYLYIGYKNNEGIPCSQVIELQRDTTINMSFTNTDYSIYLNKSLDMALAIGKNN